MGLFGPLYDPQKEKKPYSFPWTMDYFVRNILKNKLFLVFCINEFLPPLGPLIWTPVFFQHATVSKPRLMRIQPRAVLSLPQRKQKKLEKLQKRKSNKNRWHSRQAVSCLAQGWSILWATWPNHRMFELIFEPPIFYIKKFYASARDQVHCLKHEVMLVHSALNPLL